MKYIANNEVLFGLLKDFKIRILDAEIKRINIFNQTDEGLCIEIDFSFDDEIYPFQPFRLCFKGIKEYSFYHNDSHFFRIVENFTFLKKDNLYYFSFDPYDERLQTISEDDQDFVLCSGIECYM